jgi:hypothetical protein
MDTVRPCGSERVRHDGREEWGWRGPGRRGARGAEADEQAAVDPPALRRRRRRAVRHSDEACGARERAVSGGGAARVCLTHARGPTENASELPAEVRAVCEAACGAWRVQVRKEAEQTYGSARRSASAVGYACTAAPSSNS